MRLSALALSLSAFASLALPLAAQPAAAPMAPRMFMVHVEKPVPYKLGAYEKATKDFLQLVQQNRSALPNFYFQALQAEDLSYSYITPIRGFGDVDAVLAGFDTIAKTSPAWDELWRRSGDTVESVDEGVFMEMPGGSYEPTPARIKAEEERYLEFDVYRLRPGMEADARKIAAEWKALHEKHHIAASYRVYELVSGHDMPLVVVVIPAKDPADLAAIDAMEEKELGQERTTMIDRTFALTRGYEVKRYWARPDLSLMPPMTKSGR